MSLYFGIIFKSILTAIFPVYFIMLLFAVPYYRKSKWKNRTVFSYLLLIVVGFILGILAYIYIMKELFPLRYTYILIPPMLILCIPGYFEFIKVLGKYIPVKFETLKKKLPVILLIIIFFVCVGKALHPSSESIKIGKVSKAILDVTKGDKFILVTNYEPHTFSYFMKPNIVIGYESISDKELLLRNQDLFNELKNKSQLIILLKTQDENFQNDIKFSPEHKEDHFEILSILEDKRSDYVIIGYR